MTRTYTTKSGTVFEWIETQEVIDALKFYWDLVNAN